MVAGSDFYQDCFDNGLVGLNSPVFQPHLSHICVHSLLRLFRYLVPCVSGTVEICGLQDAQMQPVGVQYWSGGGSKAWVFSEFKGRIFLSVVLAQAIVMVECTLIFSRDENVCGCECQLGVALRLLARGQRDH